MQFTDGHILAQCLAMTSTLLMMPTVVSSHSHNLIGEAYSVPAVVQNRKTILAGTLDFSPDDEVFYLDHTQ